MALNFLSFTEAKTEVLKSGASGDCDASCMGLEPPLENITKPTAKNLGVYLTLIFDKKEKLFLAEAFI